MKAAHWATCFAALALGCAGSNLPSQSPPGASQNPIGGAPAPFEPAADAVSPPSPTPASSGDGTVRTPDDPAPTADPGKHAPIISNGKSSDDTPINSGAGNASPERGP